MLATIALGLAAMVIWGYLPAVARVAVVAVGLGMFFPLLGIGLAAFLVLDLLLGVLVARRNTRWALWAEAPMVPV